MRFMSGLTLAQRSCPTCWDSGPACASPLPSSGLKSVDEMVCCHPEVPPPPSTHDPPGTGGGGPPCGKGSSPKTVLAEGLWDSSRGLPSPQGLCRACGGGLGHLRSSPRDGGGGRTALPGRGEEHTAAHPRPRRSRGGFSVWAPLGGRGAAPRGCCGGGLRRGGRTERCRHPLAGTRATPRRWRGEEPGEGESPPAFGAGPPAPPPPPSGAVTGERGWRRARSGCGLFYWGVCPSPPRRAAAFLLRAVLCCCAAPQFMCL